MPNDGIALKIQNHLPKQHTILYEFWSKLSNKQVCDVYTNERTHELFTRQRYMFNFVWKCYDGDTTPLDVFLRYGRVQTVDN